MNRTKEALGNLLNYEAVSAMRPLELPSIDKAEVPNLILCPGFQRALARRDQAMERYYQRVKQAQERLALSQQQIGSLEQELGEWGRKAKGVSLVNRVMLDRSNAASVERYNRDVTRHNDAVNQVRRYEDRLMEATNRHNDLVERYNEAVAEVQAKLEELNAEALREIDGDIISFMDQCSEVAARLADSENPSDLMAALESCFIVFKIYQVLDGHLDRSAARRESREKLAAIEKLFLNLCAQEKLQTIMADLYFGNLSLMDQNADLYDRAVEVIESVDQRELGVMAQALERALAAGFKTSFSYYGIVDPVRLEKVTSEMERTISAIEANIQEAQQLFKDSRATSEAAGTAQQRVESLLATMKSNAHQAGDRLLHRGHFICDLADEATIVGFFHRELRPAVTCLRQHLAETIGAARLEALLAEDDPLWIKKTEAAIQQAGLPRLQDQRAKVEGQIRKLSGMVQTVQVQLRQAGEVPSKNAQEFLSYVALLYPLSCMPVLGFLAAFLILKKVEAFAPAFSSSLQVYRELAAQVLARNRTMQKVNMFVLSNFIAALLLGQAGKKLQSYLEVGSPILQAASSV